MKSLFDLTCELLEKHGADTPICDLPESELDSGGIFTEWLRLAWGHDTCAHNNMRDCHAWQGTVGEWLLAESSEIVSSALDNVSEAVG